ncbi:single-stranded-DNA-specific exonuclease RecJ [bacterium K02(2017)]|nr:single-stranded-DNA-specific exonuclease RecJ [bacterium K02(2017)]
MSYSIKENDQQVIENLCSEFKLSPVLAKILVNRKLIKPEQVRQFLNADVSHIHSPFLLKDMDKAVERLVVAVQENQKICIYGDYDVDGAMSTTLLVSFFEELKIQVSYYIPNRLREGYSLNIDALKKIKADKNDIVITVDNGIMAHDPIRWAHENNLDVIVTDHHQVGKDLPVALAIVNPQRKDCDYPFKGICGAGVAFKLMMGLRQRLRELDYFKKMKEPNLKSYFDLLAVATVCDVVPLIDENRYFVTEGLKRLQHTKRVGLKALKMVCEVGQREITAGDLGFKLGPRINACGRLEDASLGVSMLLATNEETAFEKAKMLDHLNTERREMELNIVKEAKEQIESKLLHKTQLGLVIADQNWHEGVVGIVASRIVDTYKRPTIVLSLKEDKTLKGSGRSVSKVSLITALKECESLLEKYGGHEAAAGMSLKLENLEAFKTAFDVAVKKQMQFEDIKDLILVDDVLKDSEINQLLMDELKKLEPHGMGNAKPVFALSKSRVKTKRLVGQKHLKLQVELPHQVIDAIAFNQGEQADEIGNQVDLVFGLETNYFRDRANLQLVVKKIINNK